MFGAAIDVALSLVFIYLLLSLFASSVQEWWAGYLNLRSKELYEGIWRMLSTSSETSRRISPRKLTPPAPVEGTPQIQLTTAQNLFDAVWGHDLIKSLSQDAKGPSYIPARTFSLALLDVLRNGSQATPFTTIEQSIDALPDGTAKQALSTLAVDAAGDLDKLKANVATWFDDAMDRVSGVYKRSAQTFTFLFGLSAAIVLNVNTIQVAAALWRDPAVRETIAGEARALAESQPQGQGHAPAVSGAGSITGIENLPLPIGWNAPYASLYGRAPKPTNAGDTPAPTRAVRVPWLPQSSSEFGWLLSDLVGWIMTALAIGLGAPFWFDTLQRFVNLRASGPQPAPALATTSAGT